MTVYGDFDFNVPLEALAARCRVRVGTEQYDRLTWLHATASGIGRPKALVVEAAVEEIDARTVRARELSEPARAVSDGRGTI